MSALERFTSCVTVQYRTEINLREEHSRQEDIMERPATWKVVTLGAALAGLSVAGAGAAQADSGITGNAPASVTAAGDLNAPLDPFHFTPFIPTPGNIFHSPFKIINSPFNCITSPWKCVPW